MSLCIISKFKNERHILYEWVHHYLLEGANVIILIDDHSDDDYLECNKWMNRLINKGTLMIVPSMTDSQLGDYNYYLNKVKQYHWVIYCDLDEFFFSVPYKSKLKRVLNEKLSQFGLGQIKWKLFTHKCKFQPKSVINSNLITNRYNLTAKNISLSQGIKCIAKTKYLKRIDIHYLEFSRDIPKKKLYDRHNPLININHYRTQSDEYLFGVKEIRGGGVNKDKYRGFKRYSDHNFDYKCNILKKKRHNLINNIIKRKQIKPKIYPESSFYKLLSNKKKSLKKKTTKIFKE